MGGEVIVFPLTLFGIAALLFLIVRAGNRASRPFALPTLVATILCASYFAFQERGDLFWSTFFMAAGGGSIVFGLHAHAVKWLYEKRT